MAKAKAEAAITDSEVAVNTEIDVVNESAEAVVESSEDDDDSPAGPGPEDMLLDEYMETTNEIKNIDVVDEEEKELIESGTIGDNNADESNGNSSESLPKYTFSEKVLDEYLASTKQEDRIVQESRGGNFVSNKTHVIYVPITLFQQ